MSAAIKPTEIDTQANNERPLPHSRRIYVEGTNPGVRVPFREIAQNQTRNFNGSLEENPPVRVYDTSGPWGNPSIRGDVRDGLSSLRSSWILGRGDVEEYAGRELKPIDDGYLTFDAANQARQKEKGRLEDFPALRRTPLQKNSRAYCLPSSQGPPPPGGPQAATSLPINQAPTTVTLRDEVGAKVTSMLISSRSKG